MAVSRYGISSALTTNPARSLAVMMVLPSLSCANSRTRCTASSDVSSHGMTSTNGRTVAGLKKCMPTTRSGPGVTAASFMIGMDDVLLVSSASGRTTLPRAANIAVLASSSSIAASATRSHSDRSSNVSVNRTRLMMSLRSPTASLPLRTALSREPARRRCAPSTAASLTSRKTTSQPLRAATSAMPDPMMPPPTTPTALTIRSPAFRVTAAAPQRGNLMGVVAKELRIVERAGATFSCDRTLSRGSAPFCCQYWICARSRNSSGVAVPNPKNSRYAGICSNSMSVPT